jgi:hypothetical protein
MSIQHAGSTPAKSTTMKILSMQFRDHRRVKDGVFLTAEEQAAEFASQIPKHSLINICSMHYNYTNVVVVWYYLE